MVHGRGDEVGENGNLTFDGRKAKVHIMLENKGVHGMFQAKHGLQIEVHLALKSMQVFVVNLLNVNNEVDLAGLLSEGRLKIVNLEFVVSG